MSTKTSQIKNTMDLSRMVCVTEYQVRKGDEWETADSREWNFDALPASVQNHVSLYGIKGFLGDRTSDARKEGPAATLAAMDDLWALMLTGQLSRPRVNAGGLDRALVHLVAELKGLALPAAEAALKALTKETREAIATKYAERLAEIRSEAQQGAAVDLGDLI